MSSNIVLDFDADLTAPPERVFGWNSVHVASYGHGEE